MTEIVEVTVDSTVIVEDTDTNVVSVIAAGPAGGRGPAGLGLPSGGTVGQILVKNSATDYDTSWSTSTGTGTVTSVGLTAPTGFSVSGSPITNSGTLAITFASGYSLPTTANQTNWDTAYNWGNHALAGYAMSGANSDITSLSGITGAIATVDSIAFDTAAGATGAVGKLLWNDTEGTLEFQMKGGNVTLQVGQEQVLRVTNQSGSVMVDGQVVYITGSTGNHLNVTLAQGNGEATSSKTIAVVTETIANNNSGFATTSGLVHGLNTSTLTEGAAIWLSPTVAGGITSTKPQAPNHAVLVGWCVKQHATVGVIYVHIANGYEVEELHDVKITGTVTAGSLLIRNATDSLWENARLTAGSGVSITNADKSITITNSAPDQTVALTSGTGINTSGTYPNFTITNSAPDQVVSLTAGTNVTITGTYPNFTIAAAGGGGGSGTVTSVGLTAPAGFAVTGSPVTTSGTLALAFDTGYALPTTASQSNWDTAYTDRLKWDGGSSGLTASTGRTSLGATTLGANLFTITNPGAVTFPRFNADNTVSALDATTFRTAIGAGTVTSVDLTASTGISISGGPITSNGSITVTNTAPDQTVVLTQGGTTTITGTYPNFTISSADQYNGTVTNVAALTIGTSGTDITSSVANETTTPVITINIPSASAANRGALTATDWSVFNNKQAALVSGTNIKTINGSSVLGSGDLTIGGSMVYPAAGIAVSTGTAWATSITPPSGAIVGTTDTQTLSGKTITGTKETVFTITDGVSVDIDPANGGIQTWALGASRTPTATNFAAGQSVTLMVDDGTAYAITWTSIGVTWLDNASAPTLQTTGYTIIELFKIGTTVYGMARR